MKGFHENMCPQCHFPKLKKWNDLTDEEKFLAERLPLSATFTKQERKTHLFCPRCWNEITEKTAENC